MLDVTGSVGLCQDLVLVDDLGIFVDNLVLQYDVLADLCISHHDAALDRGAFSDLDAAADDGIFDRTLDFAAVGDERVLDICFIVELGRAGIGGPGVDGPVCAEQGSGLVDIDQVKVGLVIGLQARDGSEEAMMFDSTDIELAAFRIDDVGQCVDRGCLTGSIHQVDQEIFFHDEGLHEDVLCILVAQVPGDSGDLLAVKGESVAGGIAFLCVEYFVIQKSDVRAGFHMILEELIVILCKDHAARSDHDILAALTADVVDVREEGIDICVVDRVDHVLIGDDDLDSAALGVDVVMTAGADVSDQRAGLGADINLNIVDSAVAEVGNREIDYTESAEEGESADGAVILHALYLMLR